MIASKYIKQAASWLVLVCLGLTMPSRILAAELRAVMPSNIGKNQVFPVEIYLDTGLQKTVGTDLLIKIDPDDMVFVQAEPTEFYDLYHEPKIQLVKGQIRYSGTSEYENYKKGKGLFATLFFKKKQIGKPQFELIWFEGRTDDTNIIGVNGDDLLVEEPEIQFDNSLRAKPKDGQGQYGRVLGEEDLVSSLFDQSNSSLDYLGQATPKVETTGLARWKKNGFRLTVGLIGLIGLWLFFGRKGENTKQGQSK